MKKILVPILALCASAVFADVTTEKTTTTSDGATSTTTTTTTGSGTITEFAPGQTFVVKESSGPVQYHYGKSVEYITRSGKRLSDDEVRTRIKVGVPVHVHYGREGEHRVINRVTIDD